MSTLSIEEAEKIRAEGGVVYEKICHNIKCNKEYLSNSRNQKYCCQDCGDYANGINKKKAKHRAKKRKEYDENKEINRALSKAYSLAHTMAEVYRIPKQCNCKENNLSGECKGELQLHHHNCNPFDNSPSNIYYLCGSHHKMFHDSYLEDINMVELFKEAEDEAGFEDDDKKHKVMVKVFKDKVEGVWKNGKNSELC